MSFRFTLIACAAAGIVLALRGDPMVAQDLPTADAVEIHVTSGDRACGWTDDQVARWAYEHSALAKLLDAERVAIARQTRLRSDEDRACVGLVQSVLCELALHQRNESAADALGVYYRGVGTNALFEPLRKIAPALEDLRDLAETAVNLELPDGDITTLEDQRLQFEDQWFQLEYGLARIEARLCQMTHQISHAEDGCELTSPLPFDFCKCTEGELDCPLEQDVEQLIEQAYANRKDLSAVYVLYRCLNEKSLPAARRLLAGMIPGGGIDLIGGLPGTLFSFASHGHSDDLAARRAQCLQLIQNKKRQIEGEIRDAVLELQSNRARLQVVTQRWRNKAQATERVAQCVAYDLQKPGAVQQGQIEVFQLEAEKIMIEQSVAESVVKLRRAVGCVLVSE